MKITNNSFFNKKDIGDIDAGTVIEYQGEFYIITDEIDKDDSSIVYAVLLRTGEIAEFYETDTVSIPSHAELIIS